jgi:hypothetical protein
VGAAERAVDVRAEPGVDAPDVERVRAPGEQPQELAVRELTEADGAVGGAAGARAVPRERDGLDRRLVQPEGQDVPRVVHDFSSSFLGEVQAAVEDAAGRQGGFEKRLTPPPLPPSADEQEKEEAEDDDEGQRRAGDDESGDEGGATVGAGRGGRGGRRR